MFNEAELRPEIREKIYRPGRDGMVEEFELKSDEEPRMIDGGWGRIEQNGD